MDRRPAAEHIGFRTAEKGDADALRKFNCSRGAWYEDEVEDYINRYAPKLVKGTLRETRVLLALDSERIVACAAHHIDPTAVVDGPIMELIRIHFFALGLDYQERELRSGQRISDAVLSAVVADARDSYDTDAFTAIVARDNLRSLSFLERNGRWSQTVYDNLHVRLTARLSV